MGLVEVFGHIPQHHGSTGDIVELDVARVAVGDVAVAVGVEAYLPCRCAVETHGHTLYRTYLLLAVGGGSNLLLGGLGTFLQVSVGLLLAHSLYLGNAHYGPQRVDHTYVMVALGFQLLLVHAVGGQYLAVEGLLLAQCAEGCGVGHALDDGIGADDVYRIDLNDGHGVGAEQVDGVGGARLDGRVVVQLFRPFTHTGFRYGVDHLCRCHGGHK